jgi:hypothetical protein
MRSARKWQRLLTTFPAMMVSTLTLVVLALGSLPERYVVLVAFAFGVWFFTLLLFIGSESQAAELTAKSNSVSAANVNLFDRYFVRLSAGLDQSIRHYLHTEAHTREQLASMAAAVSRAEYLARQTALLAVNATLSASQCGEVGRGFENVSADLASISQRAQSDLQRLADQIVQVQADLASRPDLTLPDQAQTNPGWQPADLDRLDRLHQHLNAIRKGLASLFEAYQPTVQTDVRGLQLGEAVQVLVSELSSMLAQLGFDLQQMLLNLNLWLLTDQTFSSQNLEKSAGLATLD